MNDFTEKEILNNFNVFKIYCSATETLSHAIMLLGNSEEYKKCTFWEYIRKLIKDSCPELSYEFIDKFSNAIGNIARDRLRHGLETKESLPEDFDYNKDNFEKIKEYIKKEGYDIKG